MWIPFWYLQETLIEQKAADVYDSSTTGAEGTQFPLGGTQWTNVQSGQHCSRTVLVIMTSSQTNSHETE